MHKETPVLESSFKKVASWKACKFIKKRLKHPANIAKENFSLLRFFYSLIYLAKVVSRLCCFCNIKKTTTNYQQIHKQKNVKNIYALWAKQNRDMLSWSKIFHWFHIFLSTPCYLLTIMHSMGFYSNILHLKYLRLQSGKPKNPGKHSSQYLPV